MIVVDTSVWIDNIRKTDTVQVRRLALIDESELIVGDLIMLEVLRGVQSSREAETHKGRFQAYGVTPLVTPQIAIDAAANYRKLRSLGVTIRSSIDLVIATFCIENDHELLHDDRDFDHFERQLGLRVAR